jgi:hypothetical protein
MSAAGFGPAIPATKRLQAYALDSTATWIGFGLLVHSNNITPRIKKKKALLPRRLQHLCFVGKQHTGDIKDTCKHGNDRANASMCIAHL